MSEYEMFRIVCIPLAALSLAGMCMAIQRHRSMFWWAAYFGAFFLGAFAR